MKIKALQLSTKCRAHSTLSAFKFSTPMSSQRVQDAGCRFNPLPPPGLECQANLLSWRVLDTVFCIRNALELPFYDFQTKKTSTFSGEGSLPMNASPASKILATPISVTVTVTTTACKQRQLIITEIQ